MSADLEKRLAEAFYYTGLDKHYPGWGKGGPIAECARIAAEEIEKAELSAARKVRDWMVDIESPDPHMALALISTDAALAQIIGADGHEGGGEVTGSAVAPGVSRQIAGGQSGVIDSTSEPPRPHPNKFPGPERVLERLAYEHGRAEAFEEAIDWAESELRDCGCGKRIGDAIRAAARKEKA